MTPWYHQAAFSATMSSNWSCSPTWWDGCQKWRLWHVKIKQCSYLQSLKMVDVCIRNTHIITPGTQVSDARSLNSTQIHHPNILSKWKKGWTLIFERCCWRILTGDIVQLHPSEGPDKPSFAALLAPPNEEINQWIGLRQNWNRKPLYFMGKPWFPAKIFPYTNPLKWIKHG